MKTTLKTNLNCGSCVSKVTPGLNAIDGLSTWSVDTDNPAKPLSISYSGPDVIDDVVEAVRRAGFEATADGGFGSEPSGDGGATAQHSSDSAGPGDEVAPVKLATYWPLILVLLYVCGATAFVQWLGSQWSWSAAMGSFMGFFFLAFAFFKLLNVPKFADAFSTYDIVAARSRGYALTYPFIEFGLGLAYLFGAYPVATNLVTVLVMGIGLIGVARAVAQRQAIRCACLGTAFNLPMSAVTIIENSVMIVMALAMLLM